MTLVRLSLTAQVLLGYSQTMLGSIIRTLRVAKGLTQADLSRLTGVRQSHISKIERGERGDPAHSTVQKLETALGPIALPVPSESAS